MNHREFQHLVDSKLPVGVYGYYGVPARIYRLRLTDWYHTELYFDKAYNLTNGLESIMESVLRDVEAFIVMWNSPLMEALK